VTYKCIFLGEKLGFSMYRQNVLTSCVAILDARLPVGFIADDAEVVKLKDFFLKAK
jgi:hypothetical protein